MKTTIVWFRNDLRVHDHPALWTAAHDSDHVVPVFIFNNGILHGKHAGSNRNRFLIESLQDLKQSLKRLGADLIVRSGKPADVLLELAQETKSEAVFYTSDYTPYAIQRDKSVKHALVKKSIAFRGFGGRLVVDHLNELRTKNGQIHKVFTPFSRNWLQIGRREVVKLPKSLSLPSGVRLGSLPTVESITRHAELSTNVMAGGETAGRERMERWLAQGVDRYHEHNDELSNDGTSRLSPYLHFGCISPRELESALSDSDGARAYHRQLCWRDFYNYVIFNFPHNAVEEFQERYRHYNWGTDKKLLEAWQQGKTGYPVVDAAIRQLNTEGWMHNRGRLIVGSFLTKDLGLDWRLGERYFMQMLMDGDEANNNGNWQWIASVGVDPAPVYRRLYNPALQQKKFDPEGDYIRKYVPELKNVPKKYLGEPWSMPPDVQEKAGCVIGKDYPEPIVDHAAARQQALQKYRDVADSYDDTLSRETAAADKENAH